MIKPPGEMDPLFDVNHGDDYDTKPVDSASSQANLRVIAIVMACAAGLLFGTCFNPPQVKSIMQHTPICSHIHSQFMCERGRARERERFRTHTHTHTHTHTQCHLTSVYPP